MSSLAKSDLGQGCTVRRLSPPLGAEDFGGFQQRWGGGQVMNNTDYLGWQAAQGEYQYTDEHRRAVSEGGGKFGVENCRCSRLALCPRATVLRILKAVSSFGVRTPVVLLVGGRSNGK